MGLDEQSFAATLDHALEAGNPSRQKAFRGDAQEDAVIAHQRREAASLARQGDHGERKRALSGARRTPDQRAPLAYRHRTGVNARFAGVARRARGRHLGQAGRLTTKRAPAPWRTGASVSGSGGAGSSVERAVFGPNSPEMGLHDLPRDRESEAGILSKSVVGAIGVEALEYALQRVRRDSRAVVLDREHDSLRVLGLAAGRARLAAEMDSDFPARPRERACVVDQIGDHLRQAANRGRGRNRAKRPAPSRRRRSSPARRCRGCAANRRSWRRRRAAARRRRPARPRRARARRRGARRRKCR